MSYRYLNTLAWLTLWLLMWVVFGVRRQEPLPNKGLQVLALFDLEGLKTVEMIVEGADRSLAACRKAIGILAARSMESGRSRSQNRAITSSTITYDLPNPQQLFQP